MKNLKIVFMGSPEFAAASLKALLNAGADVACVVTQPAKPSGRSKVPVDTAVKTLALGRGITVYEPKSLKDSAFQDVLKDIKPDVIAVVAYGKILPEAVLNIPRLGCVNVHASLLPKYRGAAPVNWAIVNGEKVTGVTTMLMDKGMDTGPMLLKEEIGIDDGDTAESVLEKLAPLGGSLLVQTLGLLAEGNLKAERQDESQATYAPILKKEDGLIDWSRSAVEINNRVRGFAPWPGAYTKLDGKVLKIHLGRAVGEDSKDARPGEVLDIEGGVIRVKCGSGCYEIMELQLEGKKRCGADEFTRGHKLGKKVFG
ncbi:MAG: methionyl-tRNA formyltransferase [Deltaproteobacteria bacterium]|nr:methionyl-tRNA formyltransferase [Deltaproteobacteria bacterium]